MASEYGRAAPPPRRVRCAINGEEIDVWDGYRLWDAALDANASLWKWCGGNGLCTTCAVLPLAGGENLSEPTHRERISVATWWLGKPLAFVRKRWKGKPIRLACQAYVRGPVEVVGLFGKKARKVRAAHGLP
jgi:ferredoxin, 2Fe-2S